MKVVESFWNIRFALKMKYDSFGEFLELHPKVDIAFILESGESVEGFWNNTFVKKLQ